jgi:hypothetical protein
MRIIIAGSRSFDDYGLLCRECNKIIGEYKLITAEFEIISGGARGADKLAEWYALDKNYKNTIMKADWDRNGRGAGYIRNEQMAKYAKECQNSICILFWDSESRGTKNMRDIAKKYEIKTFIVPFSPKYDEYRQPYTDFPR